jgi:quercetin dioxygenase-like cupin family protein
MNRAKLIAVVAAVVIASFLALSYASGVSAQQPGVKRTLLTRQDLSGIPGREGLLVQVELAPGVKEPLHTHPGDLFAYVQEGTITLTMEGKPTATMKQGGVFVVPAGTVHSGENTGKTPVKLLVTFVVEKGKPLTTPVQQ